MVASYEGISLDHLADHLVYLSSSSSFWFSLNSSYDHDFHLWKRLGMKPKDYESLLVSADLAHFHKRWGFSIKMSKWNDFLEGFTTINCDGTFEVDQKKVDLNAFIKGESAKNRDKVYFIRIGILNASSPRKVEMQKDQHTYRMITIPPRLSGLRLQQSTFQRLIEPILWNYILDNDDSEEGKEVVESSRDEEDESVVSPEPPSSVAASMTPVTSATLVDNDTSTKYHHLSRALGDENGYFDPADPSVRKSMQGLLQEINHLLSTKYELNVRALSSNKPISYVRVPRTKSDHAFTNSKEWLDSAINISGSAYRMSKHLIKFYNDSFLAACEKEGVPVIKPMTATSFQAMLNAGKVTGTGERELKKHLSSHLGKGFCPTRRSVNMLSEGHGVVHYGSKQFTYDKKEKSEFVEWTEKNIDEEMTIYLQRHLSSKSIQPCDVKCVQMVVGGDHGDTAFQFGASVLVELADDSKINFELSVCELICRKDTGRLLEETILERLTSGLEIIATFELHLFKDAGGSLIAEFRCPYQIQNPTAMPTHTPITEVFVTGDLAFQAMVLGKESMAGHWCM